MMTAAGQARLGEGEQRKLMMTRGPAELEERASGLPARPQGAPDHRPHMQVPGGAVLGGPASARPMCTPEGDWLAPGSAHTRVWRSRRLDR